MKKEKICFVVMGFGKKKDPETNRTIDLDETYKKIIRPAVEACKISCVRADEIIESAIIDRSMFALLYQADIVIADISTDNPNAVYELGIRHALKKHSTIIIKEGKGKIAFDFNHNRILNYEYLGNEISKTEASRCINNLKLLIKTIIENPVVDSPLYTFIPNIKQPFLSDEDLLKITGELKDNENTIYALTEKAKDYMIDNKFKEASEVWEKLSKMVDNENYYIQQQALCTYKSKFPDELVALTNAIPIISKITEANDTETLGITGAIYKRLWMLTQNVNYLDLAIENYGKGWNLFQDYYTGENYALCQLEKSKKETGDESTFYKIGAKKVFEEIVKIILKSLENTDLEEFKWKYATLSNSYLAINDMENSAKYENLFSLQNPNAWEIETFNNTKQLLIQ